MSSDYYQLDGVLLFQADVTLEELEQLSTAIEELTDDHILCDVREDNGRLQLHIETDQTWEAFLSDISQLDELVQAWGPRLAAPARLSYVYEGSSDTEATHGHLYVGPTEQEKDTRSAWLLHDIQEQLRGLQRSHLLELRQHLDTLL